MSRMWSFSKRIVLFIMVNILVVATISIVLNLLGVRPYLNSYGIDYGQLMVFCLVWGMGGAFISLQLSRVMAKWMMGVKVIPTDTRDPVLQGLLETVHRLARQAGLPKMPQVGIYESPEVNAFATGPSRSRSLVAVSTGLLDRLKEPELEGVLGHEIAHVANGDMVTMTLLQGIVNAFVMFLARAIAFAIAQAIRGNSDRDDRSAHPGMLYPIITMVLEVLLMFLGFIIIGWFSRLREYRADAGGARLAGRDNMVSALKALRRTVELIDPSGQQSVQAFKINGRRNKFAALFSTHPPLEERIKRLEMMMAA